MAKDIGIPASDGRSATDGGAAAFVPATQDVERLAEAARSCRGCELYRDATQTVFGAGPHRARVMMVGEQPGDQEDRSGLPFVGPAGRLLDQALAEARIRREDVYLTNAVKHFRFKSTDPGKRRIHAKPSAGHIAACRPWLAAEIDAVQPEIVVVLGATAAQALLGNSFRVTAYRGELLDWPAAGAAFAEHDWSVRHALATVHPASVLRADSASRRAARTALVDDLRAVARWLARVKR